MLLAPGDITWAVVLPRGDPRIGRGFNDAYARLGAPLVSWFSGRGVEAEWRASAGRSVECCPLGPRGQVLATSRGILSGAAQHVTHRTLLHHGTLSRTVDRALHRAIFRDDDPSSFDRLIGTEELGIPETPERVRAGLERIWSEWLARP